MTDVETEAPASETPSSPRSPVLVLAISLAVVFAIAAAALGVVAARNSGGDGQVDSLRRSAGQVAQALLTYDYNDPDAHRDRVLALATGSFRNEYSDQFDHGLRELITKVQAKSEGFVKDVFVSEIDAERAEAVVVSDVTRDGAGGKRTLYDIYILLTFVDVNGTWKVDQVTDLNFATSGADPSATTTSTPVP
jgi:hypothetical protein